MAAIRLIPPNVPPAITTGMHFHLFGEFTESGDEVARSGAGMDAICAMPGGATYVKSWTVFGDDADELGFVAQRLIWRAE